MESLDPIAQQFVYLLIIAVAGLFGALLYRRHAARGHRDERPTASGRRQQRKARPRKQR